MIIINRSRRNDRKTKKKLLLLGLVIFSLLGVSFLGMMNTFPPANEDNATPAVNGGFGSSGLWQTTYRDLFGWAIFTTNFEANWTYSWSNGSWIHGYAIYWKVTKVAWDVVAWIHMENPKWANTAPNTYVGYSNGQYHIGIWYISTTQGFHSQEKVPPNSWGSGYFSSGMGNVYYNS